MPIDQTTECLNCGYSIPLQEEKCPSCGMYKGEDPEEFGAVSKPITPITRPNTNIKL